VRTAILCNTIVPSKTTQCRWPGRITGLTECGCVCRSALSKLSEGGGQRHCTSQSAQISAVLGVAGRSLCGQEQCTCRHVWCGGSQIRCEHVNNAYHCEHILSLYAGRGSARTHAPPPSLSQAVAATGCAHPCAITTRGVGMRDRHVLHCVDTVAIHLPEDVRRCDLAVY
jgi:hypothetical protein